MTISSGVPNSLTFGVYNSAPTSIIGDVGGQTVTLKGANNIVHSIQIGDAIYGGGGGNVQGVGVLPADGTFFLLNLENTTNGPMHYMKLRMSDSVIEAGSMADGNQRLIIPSGLKVKFGSITYTSNQINQIQFLLVPSN